MHLGSQRVVHLSREATPGVLRMPKATGERLIWLLFFGYAAVIGMFRTYKREKEIK